MMGMGQVKNWLVVEPNPSERYEFASWDHDIPNMMGKSWNSMVPVTTNQKKNIHYFCFKQARNRQISRVQAESTAAEAGLTLLLL